MKTFISTAISLLLFITTLSAQKKYSKEEQTLIDLIQQHYNHWKNREYEKWTELWVHESYVGHTYIGPNNFVEHIGWEEVSTTQKNFIKNNPNPAADVDFGKFDYTFVITDNMAIAKFIGENGLHTTSVFEKVNGTWKYILNEQFNKPMFELRSDIAKLGSFEGNWQLIPDSFKWENSDNKGKIIMYAMNITHTLNGADISSKFNFKNAQQSIWRGTENISVIKHSPSSKLIHTMSTYFSNNGWTNNSSGKAEVSDQSIELNGARIGNERVTYTLQIKKESEDQLKVSSTNNSGEKWSVDMKLIDE